MVKPGNLSHVSSCLCLDLEIALPVSKANCFGVGEDRGQCDRGGRRGFWGAGVLILSLTGSASGCVTWSSPLWAPDEPSHP